MSSTKMPRELTRSKVGHCARGRWREVDAQLLATALHSRWPASLERFRFRRDSRKALRGFQPESIVHREFAEGHPPTRIPLSDEAKADFQTDCSHANLR